MLTARALPPSCVLYEPFPDVPRRNFVQQHVEVPLLVRALGLPTGGRVLEVGCGRGIALPPLFAALQPSRLVGIDIDPDLVSLARRRIEGTGIVAEVQRADVRRLPFEAASFDLVIDFGTCYHITNQPRALREIVRVLAPGGLFVSETVSSQLLSHPWRTRGRRLPWATAPELRVVREALLWKARQRSDRRGAAVQ